jgi:predicted nucleotidyltransferase
VAAPVAQIRLSAPECDAIRRAVERACREVGARWNRIVLFGSRTDPSRRGGDIDLLVELVADSPADIYVLTQRLRLALEDELGSQRIDLVVDDGTVPTVFADLARSRGVELWSNR